MITRTLKLAEITKKKSHFLFGPRGVGKSFLIRAELASEALVINLLRPEFFLRLSSHPEELEAIIDGGLQNRSLVVIDEIQKLPLLLDEVHRLIEERRLSFLLTGSSARKLRHGGANLLAGRAWPAELYPLTAHELGQRFNLERYLRFGGLPAVYLADEPEEELQAYVGTYVQEEIKAEGLVRKLQVFSAFLSSAAHSNTQVLNFAKIASDLEVSAPTIREYFSVLEDTLVGVLLTPWRRSKQRKATAAAKFYFFDTGVTHTLAGTRALDPNSNLFGQAFEQWVFMELRAWISYTRRHQRLSFWRVDDRCEVDFLIGEELAIEVKATKHLRSDDFTGLRQLRAENIFKTFIIISQDPVSRYVDGVHCLHWQEFIQSLWSGRLDQLAR